MLASLKEQARAIRANCSSQRREPTAAEYGVLALRQREVVQKSALPVVVSCLTPLGVVGLGIHLLLRSEENRLIDKANEVARQENLVAQRYARTQLA